ncbi:MAG: hypothetical protein DRG30_03780 [Epsilonproteobacteria bacterium]|nr:MAG: hypothetical protein DRG30_03780 [Campylobacterota bacterium]
MMKAILSVMFAVFFLFSNSIYAEEPTQESTTELYIAFFDRASDTQGLEYWLKSGLSLEQIAESFFQQDETQKRYPDSLANELFITTVYQNIFNHEPDDEGLQYWVNELDSEATTRALSILAIVNGATGDDKIILQNKTEVGFYFADNGLNDAEQAEAVMEGVSVDTQSVEDAKDMIDEFADLPVPPPESLMWTKQFGTDSYEWGKAVTTDKDGDVYITGTTGGYLDGQTLVGNWDAFITKFDSYGQQLWTRQFGTKNSDMGNAIIVDSLGKIYITGEMGGRAFLTIFDGGTRVSTEKFGEWAIGHSIAIDKFGDIFITGSTKESLENPGEYSAKEDIFLAKFKNDGTQIWIRQFGSTEDDIAYSVGIDSHNDIYLSGVTTGDLEGHTQRGAGDLFLSKFNSDGTMIWTTQFGSYGSDTGCSMDIDGEDNIYIAGGTSGDLIDDAFISETWDIFLTKLNTEGETEWMRQYGTPQFDATCSVATDGDGKIYLTGITSGDLAIDKQGSGGDIFLSEFDSSGVRRSTEQYGSERADIGYSLTVDSLGAVYITGMTEGDLDGENSDYGDIFLSKFK